MNRLQTVQTAYDHLDDAIILLHRGLHGYPNEAKWRERLLFELSELRGTVGNKKYTLHKLVITLERDVDEHK